MWVVGGVVGTPLRPSRVGGRTGPGNPVLSVSPLPPPPTSDGDFQSGVSVVVDVLAAFMRKNGVVSDMFYRIAESREVNTWRRNGFERILQVPFPPSGLGGTCPHLSGWREDAVTREREGGVW